MPDKMSDIEKEVDKIAKRYWANTHINKKIDGQAVHCPEIKIDRNGLFSKVVITGTINFKKIKVLLIGGTLSIRATLDNKTNDVITTKDSFKTNYIRIEYKNNILNIFSYVGNIAKNFKYDESGWQSI